MNRNLLLLTACLFSVIILSAQIKSPFTSIRPQLEKVINDYPNQFSSIKGTRNQGDPNTIQYASTVEMKGAVETKVIGYPTKTKINWLWEAKLFVTDDMAELKKQYKSYYNDIAGKSFMSKGANNSINATGPYNAPSEELRLWTNQFRMNDVTGEFGNLVIDLVAEYANFEWIVYVRIYDKEKDEDMKPTKDKNDKYRY
ncbi:MAG: hypothetical protein IPK31_07910 [Chitinophagaceae bacterium]|nr:hypothetical protein [Chitinophagaceae bacterium]